MMAINVVAFLRPFYLEKTHTMAIFKRKKSNEQPKKSMREIGVAGNLVFEGYEKEESNTGSITIQEAREMLDKDPTIESLYNIFTLPIIAATYRIDADKDDTGEVQADLVRRNLLEPPHKGGMQLPFSLFLDQLLLSKVDGFQLWEKVYRIDDGKITYKKLAHRDSIGLTLIRDEESGYGGARQQVTYGNDVIDVTLPANKTFLFTNDKARSFLYGRSSLTSLRGPYLKKRRLEYLDSIALQADAIKPKLLKRTADALLEKDDESIIGKALSALARLGERRSTASIPQGYDVDVLTSEGRDPHTSIERQNSEMARAFLATFMLLGSQGKDSNVGSYALSTNLSDMLMLSLTAFMKKVEEHINQYVIADLHDLNFATPYYSSLKFNDLTSDVIEVITESFQKLIEKDRISADMIKGIEEAAASRLEIDIDRIRKDREKLEKKASKEAANKTEDEDTEKPTGSRELSDISSRDFPGLHESLDINTDKLGCIMLDLQTFDITKHVEGGEADLVQTTGQTDHTMGAVAETEAHVTLLFGLLQNGNTIKEQVDKVLDGWNLDSVVLDEITSFPVAPDSPHVPIVAKLWDTRLIEAHDRLSLLPHVNTFTEYDPHVTLAYVKNDPDIVQKWVKALRTELAGMRLNAIGINYGDLPNEDDNKEDDANSGGKFLSDGSLRWWRPLTPAEKTVRFAEINAKMDSFESIYTKAAEPLLTVFAQNLVEDGITTKKMQEISVELPAEYVSLVRNTIKTAYNYAKTGAADEQKVAAPATSTEALAGIEEMTDFVISKQQDDIRGIIAEERLQFSTKLADEDTLGPLSAAIAAALTSWIASILQPTAGAIVGRAVNNGRNDVFESIETSEDRYQYSGILDSKICSTCRSLDGSVITPEEYHRTSWKPPLHFHCRCIWVLIRKLSADYEMPPLTGIDNDHVRHIHDLKTIKKQELIDSGILANGVAKTDAESLLMYQGTYYKEINEYFRTGAEISDKALDAAVRIDNLMKRNALGFDLNLYRGFGSKSPLVVGDQISDAAFFSTSRSEVIGRNFAINSNDKYKYVLRFTAPTGYNAIDMNSILLSQSSLPHEKEILLPRGQSYIIKSMSKPDEHGIVDVDIALVGSNGKELADTSSHVITREELDRADKALGVDGDVTPDSAELGKINAKIAESNKQLKITKATA